MLKVSLSEKMVMFGYSTEDGHLHFLMFPT